MRPSRVLARFVAGGMAVAAPAPTYRPAGVARPEPEPAAPAARISASSAQAVDGGCNIAILAGLAVIPLVVAAGLHADPEVHLDIGSAKTIALTISELGRWIRLI